MKLQNYTLRYLGGTTFILIGIWAVVFYFFIAQTMHNSVDEDLKRLKLNIIRESYTHPEILQIHSYGAHRFRFTPLPRSNYKLNNRFENTEMLFDYEDEPVPVRKLTCIFYDRNYNSYRLEIISTIMEGLQVLKMLIVAFISLYVAILLSMLLLNQIFIRYVWNSFFSTIRQLRGFRLGGEQKLELTKTSIDEFNFFIFEIGKIIDKIRKSYQSQKSFIENVAHELQTPLAIVRTKLELLSDNKDITEEQIVELSKIGDTVNRMIRLNKSLLLLSKVDNMQYSNTELIDFCDLTTDLLVDFSDLAEYKGITIQVDFKSHFVFTMNHDLAVILISNLLKNAITHNVFQGQIRIEATDNYFLIQNKGTTIPLNEEYIFERFYKRGENEQSSGLGLAIVRSIVDSTLHLRLMYSYIEDFHVFKLIKK